MPKYEKHNKKIWVRCVGFGLLILLIAALVSQIPAFIAGMRGGITSTAIAHRGLSSAAPENTIIAYEKALELGITAVETDVFKTKDGAIVLSHDETIDRCSDGTGLIRDMTLEELRQYDYGAWYGAEFAGTQIPTLEEFLDAVKDAALILLEFKTNENGIVPQTIDVVRERGMMEQVLFQSFDMQAMQDCKDYAPEAKVALLYHAGGDYDKAARKNPAGFCEEYRLDALHPNYAAVTARFARRCEEAGVPLRVWTVNKPIYMTGLSAQGVDGIITDVPGKVAGAAQVPAIMRGLGSVAANLYGLLK